MLISFKTPMKTPKTERLFSKFPTKGPIATLLLVAATTLTGCDDLFEPTISEICESNSEICLDLSLDARCRAERAEIIRLRYYNQDSKDEAYKYPLLLNFEEYLTCVEEVQHIEHVKRKGKEATRLKGVITAQREIKRLSRETKNSLDPYLSYYHWTRYNDKDAFHRFERYAASNRVSDPKLLVALASVQIKSDPERTIDTLYRALSLYTNSDDIDVSIFYSLASMGMSSDNHRLAYVWYGVAENYDERINETQREHLGQKYALPVEILDSIVDEIVSSLNSTTFNAASLKLDKL
ncbi:DUF2989 domain-containing protein [Alteromonas sp. ALT199]|uniref:DUF2989 domain-containing protein n=1 Tax=unclassified Alteromonas TaxID=2614992 RepID=UPI000449881D|nr:DUF2989 domain-containing protein [Alteromonas sp. ALT199]MBT3136722.1 DUF2989 domain-containing protein [Alteromonas sp. ALT199]